MDTNNLTPPAPTAPSQGPITIAVAAVLLGFNVFFIGLRCFTSARISRDFDFNDVFMIGAVLIYAGLFAILVFSVQSGVGGHTLTAGLVGIRNSLKFIFLLEIIYVLLTSLMKASLAITLLQWATSKLHIRLLQTAILIDALICIIVVEYFLVQCAPISYTWRITEIGAKGVCLPQSQQLVIGMVLSAVTISLDMLFLFVPFAMIRGRQIRARVRAVVYAIFGLGVLASIANFIRLAKLVKLKASTDPLFDAAPVFLWSAVEVSIGISVAGIIELRPLLQRLNIKGFGSSQDNSQFKEIAEDRIPIRLETMGLDMGKGNGGPRPRSEVGVGLSKGHNGRTNSVDKSDIGFPVNVRVSEEIDNQTMMWNRI